MIDMMTAMLSNITKTLGIVSAHCRWYKRTVFDKKPKTVEKRTGAEIGRGNDGAGRRWVINDAGV